MQKDVYFYKLHKAQYPQSPANPDHIFPELSNLAFDIQIDETNEVYGAVREVLINLGLDSNHVGTTQWNPFREFVKPGQKVLIKPNQVYHAHPKGDREVLGMVTNAAVVRPLIDYVLLATSGKCSIIIADAPVQGADFRKVTELSGMTALVQYYSSIGVEIELLDLRILISERNKNGILGEKYKNPTRNSEMYRTVDLKEKTELYEVINSYKKFEITDYGYGSVAKHHNKEVNEYIIPIEVLEADFFINVPKLKTHRKAGMTCALKNIVGINGDKTCLAHHTRGVKGTVGDEFNKKKYQTIVKQRIWTFLKTNKAGIFVAGGIANFFKKYVWKGQSIKEYNMLHKPEVFSEGSWYGNDTLWRCVKDLNKILLYADREGSMRNEQQRGYICIVDALKAGEGEGPMEQTTKEFGVIFGGMNPVYVDLCATKLMKYDYMKLPLVKNSFINKWWDLVDKEAEQVSIDGNISMNKVAEYFIPSYGWQDYLTEKANK